MRKTTAGKATILAAVLVAAAGCPSLDLASRFGADGGGSFLSEEETTCNVMVRKFNDLNANGVVDEGEPEIGTAELVNDGGWPVYYTDPGGTEYEGVTPLTCVEAGVAGTWTFWEGSVEGWSATGATVNGEAVEDFAAPIEVEVTGEGEELFEIVFLNVQEEEECNVRIRKFNDLNGNGVVDDGEPEIGLTEYVNDGGWPVSYRDPNWAEYSDDTPACFNAEIPGTWTFWEGSVEGWAPTGATVNGEAVEDFSAPIEVEVAGEGEELFEIVFLNTEEAEEPCNLRIRKFNDLNSNGLVDDGEPEIGVTEYINDAGWPVYYRDPNGTESAAATPACVNAQIAGVWTVWEGAVEGWVATGALVNWEPVEDFASPIEVEFTGSCDEVFEVVFLNTAWVPPQTGTICAVKGYDADGNGYSENDAPIEGVRVCLEGCDNEGNPIGPLCKYTGASGTACWEGLAPGNYTVSEDLPEGHWVATMPCCVEVELSAGEAEEVFFANYCTDKIEMHSKGWWHSKHGCAVVAAHPDILETLNTLPPFMSGVVYVGGKGNCKDCGCQDGEGMKKGHGNGHGRGHGDDGDRDDNDCDHDCGDCEDDCGDCDSGHGKDKRCAIYLPFDDCCELSRYLVAPNSQDHRIGLTQQLAAFALNVSYECGSFELYLSSEDMTAQEIIDAAVEAWESGDDVNYWKSVLDRLNNGRTIYCVSPVPCPVVYCD